MIEYLFARRARSPLRGEHRSGLGLICSRLLAFDKDVGVPKPNQPRHGLDSQTLNHKTLI